jgi:hypothetical protein
MDPSSQFRFHAGQKLWSFRFGRLANVVKNTKRQKYKLKSKIAEALGCNNSQTNGTRFFSLKLST